MNNEKSREYSQSFLNKTLNNHSPNNVTHIPSHNINKINNSLNSQTNNQNNETEYLCSQISKNPINQRLSCQDLLMKMIGKKQKNTNEFHLLINVKHQKN